MSMRVVRTLPEEPWRRFVDEHPQGNIFHTPEMFQVFSRARGHRPELWAAVEGDRRILALFLPVRVTLWIGPLGYFTTRSVVYGSLLCAPGAEGQAALAALLGAYRRQKAPSLFTELRNLSDMSEVRPVLHGEGFVYEDHLNFLIDLQRTPDQVWGTLHNNVRTNVRKARRMGVEIEEIVASDKIAAACALLGQVYKRIQVPLAHPSLFEAAFEILQPRHMVKFWMARVGDVCAGVAIRLLYKDVVYAWYAGALSDYAAYKVNDMLGWHTLEWGAQNGYSYFDFGGAGKPDEDYGPRQFKSKFGGVLVNYGRYVCVHHPHRLELSKRGYQLVRRFL